MAQTLFSRFAERLRLIGNRTDGQANETIREIVIEAAKAFKPIVMANPNFAGISWEISWPSNLAENEVNDEIWFQTWNAIANGLATESEILHHNPTALRLTEIHRAYDDKQNIVGSVSVGSMEAEDWVKRAERSASVCDLLANKLQTTVDATNGSNVTSTQEENDTIKDKQEKSSNDYRPLNAAALRCIGEWEKRIKEWETRGRIGRKPPMKSVIEDLCKLNSTWSESVIKKRLEHNPGAWKKTTSKRHRQVRRS